jgi:hypothetical protein
VTIPPASYVVLDADANSYLAVASLTGPPLRPTQSVTFTFTFTFQDNKTASLSDLAVPVAVPLSEAPRPSA